MTDNNIVVMHEREFQLDEPSVGVALRILNMIGALGIRADKYVSRFVEEPTNRATLFGLLAVLGETDLIRLGSAVLQFEDDREGRKWLKEHGIKIAPLVQALFINLQLSDDLVEAMEAFFGGIEAVSGTLTALAPPEIAQPPTGDDEPGS